MEMWLRKPTSKNPMVECFYEEKGDLVDEGHEYSWGGVAAKHLQLYLDEFCFHSNAEMLPDREAIFNLLLSVVLNKKSLSYKIITSQSAKR